MSQNSIQFQHDMSLNELIERYGTDAQCEQTLEQARWPDGFVCPACGADGSSRGSSPMGAATGSARAAAARARCVPEPCFMPLSYH
jgi:hypothetical protein